MRLAALGELARQATSLQRLSRPALERLTASTGETSNLVILEDGEAVNVDVVESPRPLKHVGWLGRRLPKHATASGKTLLAWRSRDEVLSLLELPLRKFTHTTITEVDALLEQLAEIRRVGYSVAWKEFEEDLVGIAAPVRDFTGGVVGVLTIGAPISRVALTMVPALGLKVVAVADAVSKDLGYLAATARALGSSALRGSVEDPA
jgi:DNA-binding IclR family transcriptional regulator